MTTHGQSSTGLYKCWENMRERARIVGCDVRWSTFLGFVENPPTAGPSPIDGIERTYEPGLCLCRTNDRGGYSPENCRWDTRRNNTLEQRQYTKVSDQQVDDIRRRYARGGTTQRQLAAFYGITQAQIHNITSNKQRGTA